MFNLNLNIDHFATLRNARGGSEPDPVSAALIAEISGVSGIVAHLRKNRKHIRDNDVFRLKESISTHLNLEICTDSEIIDIACKVQPEVATLVPERENEITTEGGLDVANHIKHLKECCSELHAQGITVSLFIEPSQSQLEASLEVGADAVEFNTLNYSLAKTQKEIQNSMKIMNEAVVFAERNNLFVAAGHSLNYQNIREFCSIINIREYNIGHSIVSRSLFVGLPAAIKEMNDLILKHKTFFSKINN